VEEEEANETADKADAPEIQEATLVKPKPVITETDLPPAVLFSQLADENYLVSKQDISSRWGEMREMLSDGDLTNNELDELWNSIEKAPGTNDRLDEEGFLMLYDKIDELFEDADEADEDQSGDVNVQVKKPSSGMPELKQELLELIQDLDSVAEDEGRQPCGLDCTELEQERVLEVGFFHFCNGYVLSEFLRHDWLTLLFLCCSCAGSRRIGARTVQSSFCGGRRF
jgi:hypothetical protein